MLSIKVIRGNSINSDDHSNLEERLSRFNDRLVLNLDFFLGEKPGTIGAGLSLAVAVFD